MEPFKQQSIRQLSCFHQYPEIISGITTRNGGLSHGSYASMNMGLHVQDEKDLVIENRKLLADEIGIPLSRWVIGEQVHGTEAADAGSQPAGAGSKSLDTAVAGVDGLITKEKNLVLGAFYADCVPLYFFDPESQWIGIAHAGWKGTVHGMAGRMISALEEKGCSREDIQVVIGPCISPEHYEVDDNVIRHIPKHYHESCVSDKGGSRYQLDLKELNRQMLMEMGMQESAVQVSSACTYEKEDQFYSHRRDQGKTGRMLGFIALKA
ncbi:peptidoglycan editing factor PgeF [Halobacillus litoralis]|uniref:Purine nucleoside phosphorylase n=1 Tax=Halobacillus litoralis TaxID=45668 RepID=A0A845DNY1_9BACI|nr:MULTISPECIES: peptidoglycan editing factor PgeF [Halobacillus]MYL19103.1 peptidoglycan editing factor PgeF [Halobacillus litoralis]MYL28251.1 peptidoglycan editing factor PgeF [Halobacillus halophilus]